MPLSAQILVEQVLPVLQQTLSAGNVIPEAMASENAYPGSGNEYKATEVADSGYQAVAPDAFVNEDLANVQVTPTTTTFTT